MGMLLRQYHGATNDADSLTKAADVTPEQEQDETDTAEAADVTPEQEDKPRKGKSK